PLLDARLDEDAASSWANPPGLLVFHPRTFTAPRENAGPVAKRYPEMDWALLANGQPEPGLCLTLRGGSTSVGHSHLDLLSFHCVVGDEPLLANVPVREYLDTTFSPRRNDLWEIRPDAKNTLLINGVGVRPGSAVSMHDAELDNIPGFVLEGAEAFGDMGDGPVAAVCNRAFLLLHPDHALIVDRVRVPHYARVEARFHTAFACDITQTAARIAGERNSLHLRFASSTDARLHRAINPVTAPALAEAEHMLRWCTDERCHHTWFATLLSRVETSEPVFKDVSERAATLKVEAGGRAWALRFDEAMRQISLDAR
ncbi:MAG: heparinase II/III domain-containing protein, partial [Phycisphaeraceae bacterium]